MSKLTIAIPTGRLGKSVKKQFIEIGSPKTIFENDRKLQVYDQDNDYQFMFLKPSDILTYVNNGIADVGIVGKDLILEQGIDVYQLLKMSIGKCKLVIAGYDGTPIYSKEEPLKVATKYTNFTKNYFNKVNNPVQLIKLNGSVEVAPLVGLSDVIVDITETGTTLKENGLSVLEEIEDISAEFIANKVSYRFLKSDIDQLTTKLKGVNK